MKTFTPEPEVAICVLTFGPYPALAERVLSSISQNLERSHYRLIVGANAVGRETRDYLERMLDAKEIDELIVSETNLGKCPMMRQMFSHVHSKFVWWFDDDSYVISRTALPERLEIARAANVRTVMWGDRYFCDDSSSFCHGDPVAFVRSASWYRGLPPPFWAPGGKGEFNFRGRETGDGRWIFLQGGGWFARFSALIELNWPDQRLRTFGEDVFLGEAVRQQGWEIQHIGSGGMRINTELRRWNVVEDHIQNTAMV